MSTKLTDEVDKKEVSMNDLHNAALTRNAQKLRREMTEEERKLWYTFLKNLPYPVKRQKVIGCYIVDFCIDKAKIIIELDGSQHYSEEGERADIARDNYLKKKGYQILHFTNLEIQRQFLAVCAEIEKRLTDVLGG